MSVMPQALSKKYSGFAKSIMSALPPEEVPADLSDSHLFVKVCDIGGSFQYLNEHELRDAATTVANGYESCISMVKVGLVLQLVIR